MNTKIDINSICQSHCLFFYTQAAISAFVGPVIINFLGFLNHCYTIKCIIRSLFNNLTFDSYRSVGSSTSKPTLQNRSVGSSILGGTTGWNMEVDLGKRLVFPDVVQTTLRPDIVLWSKAGKKLIVIELTVPWETRCEEAYERKKAKYTELLDLCKEKGWRTWLFPVEVGARGFCSQSVCRLMTAVGTSGRDRKRAIQRLSQAAERASSWLWLRREEMSWKQSTNAQ